MLDETKDDIAPGTAGVRALCPTRWRVCAGSMLSIIQNYTVLNELWDEACNVDGDTETIARIRGTVAQMASFEFFFWAISTISVGRFSMTRSQLQKVKLQQP